ncbi:NADH-ubiquinone oxidoreductase-F iron-sulfur binding region domain-containing protein [Paratractidigestivibacter sp.]|uniref:NADH-ubiquinone oxidoreductase-F iron-sulfur binding region domain-containing protein n=1 Tax=Paratractidigestivibacter sp. TaxID=2847316 RepID=UPI002ABDBDEA|nr:NADH-ubiquinone oxidoreductase-F iron-sulfur binding region domain-containing protein [Paratractidigestivibacter sp.]
MIIVNFMPAHKQAPVALWLLKKDVAAAAEKIKSAGAEAVLVPAGDPVATELASALDDAARVVECNPELGFVYANGSAAARTLVGEKPIPSHAEGEGDERCLYGSELLCADGKRWVWLEGAEAPVQMDATATVGALVEAAGAEDAKAVYVGYPAGALYKADDAAAEVVLGSDYVRVYTAKNCMANALNEICALYRHETCGRCVFGHEGSHQIATIVADICRKKGKPTDLALLRDLCPVMATESLCEQGRVMARTVLAFLDLFEAEISQHFTKKVCAAGECTAFLTVHILASKCQACNACVDSCEEDAILGRPRFIHVIDQKACTQCGACLDSCEYGAIVTAGAVKPKCPPKPIPFKRK